VRAQPGDGHVLLLAATAAVLDQRPDRAQVFLKRFSKRYVAIGCYHLLRALALAQGHRLESARSVLEAHGLANRFDALQNFPGGWTRREWLFRQHDRIFGRDKPARRKRAAADPECRRSLAPSRSSRRGRETRLRRLLRSRHQPRRRHRQGYR
jgi:hypothetical protein